MPDLKIKGSVNDNFGEYLPTPIIDYVGIRDGGVDVQVSLFFNFSDLEEDPNAVLDYFTDPNQAPLYVTVAYVLGNGAAQNLITKIQTDIFKELYNSKNGSYKFKGETINVVDDNSNYSSKLFKGPQEGWVQSDQNFYTENEEKLVQYSTSINLPVSINNKNLTLVNIGHNVFLAPNGSLADEFEGALTIFAFCSWFDPEGGNPYTNTTIFDASSLHEQRPFPVKRTTIEDDIRSLETFYADLMPNVTKQQVSNIAYQQVFANGAANVNPEVLFVDQEGVFYNQTPILSIEGKYHKQTSITLEQITNIFQELVNQINELPEPPSDLQAVADDIGTILAVDGEKSDLFVKLNLVRTTFPEKSTATELGRFYEKFKTRFFGVHETILQSPTVTEKLVRTSKVRDLRESSAFEYEAPTTEQPIVVYGRNRDTKEGLVTALKIWQEGADESSDDAVSVKNGFWFFDYELAVENYAALGQVFNLTALQRRFGSNFITRNFKVEEARMHKYVYKPKSGFKTTINEPATLEEYQRIFPDATTIPSKEWVSTLKSKIEYLAPGGSANPMDRSPQTTEFTLEVAIGSKSKSTAGQVLNPPEDSQNTVPTVYLTQLGLRGVDALNDEEIQNSHGLMTFEFQDVEQKYQPLFDKEEIYQFEVDCVDTSKSLIQALIASFVDTFNNILTEYYELASQNCSYNNIDGVFNNFFTEGIMGYYANTEPQYYPWVYAPAMYNYHRDVLTDAFAGDDQKLIDDSRAITSRINPTNGNLEDLDTFYQNFQKIVKLYESGGAIYDLVESMDDSRTITFGNGSVEPDKVQYFPMPTPVPLTTDVYIVKVGDEVETQTSSTRTEPEEPKETFNYKKVKYKADFIFADGGTRTESKDDFLSFMEDLFNAWFYAIEDTGFMQVSKEQLNDLLDTSIPYEGRTGYYKTAKRVVDDLVRDAYHSGGPGMTRTFPGKAEAIDALKKWIKYAWFNSGATANGRPGHGWNWRGVVNNGRWGQTALNRLDQTDFTFTEPG